MNEKKEAEMHWLIGYAWSLEALRVLVLQCVLTVCGFRKGRKEKKKKTERNLWERFLFVCFF